MKAPLSWISDYVDIKSDLRGLMWKMTEIGLTCESFEQKGNDKILDIEVTPNRPDWLSIVGIAREIAVLENTKLKTPTVAEFPKPTKNLPINIKFQTNLTGGYAGITIEGVSVKDSPKWLSDKLIGVGLRPINNLVDITNFVMFEFGIPIHVFDYDKFLAKVLTMTLSKGKESFESVDGIKYKLPANTLIIKDKDRVIDLCGIKGGANTGISEVTKNIFIHAPVYEGSYIRKTSQKLKLRSDASYIYERGPNPASIDQTLKRVVALVLELAGGEIASKPIRQNNQSVGQTMTFEIEKLNDFIGESVTKDSVVKTLEKLEFQPKDAGTKIKLIVPNFRSDIKIVEDVFEEIIRIHGLNKLEGTLPQNGPVSTKIPYLYDRGYELKLKHILSTMGFYEVQTSALTSHQIIDASQLNEEMHLKISNPVSGEYEFFRTTLIPSLLAGIDANTQETARLFEYAKVYFTPVDKAKEIYKIAGVVKGGDFRNFKGSVDYVLEKLNISDFEIKPYAVTKSLWHPTKAGVLEKDGHELGIFGEINTKVLKNLGLKAKIFAFELNVNNLKNFEKQYNFAPLPGYPPQIEDLTIKVKGNIEVGKLIEAIKKVKQVSEVNYVGKFENSLTFRVLYSDPTKTLTDKEVEVIRKEIIKRLKVKYDISIKN